MRTAAVFAVLPMAGVLLVGCSEASQTRTGPATLTPITPSHGRGTTTSAPSTTITASNSVATPQRGGTAADAVAWVEAAGPADAADFHVALRGGTSTQLGDDVAFTTPFGASCMTDLKRSPSDLACLVNLVDPPSQPPDVYGAWKGGWVDFDGTTVRIGSAHGDPGRFAAGQGAPIPPDRSLSFGDYRCRTDATALVCVNYAHKTAVRYSDDGVDPFGCARESPPPAGVGLQYRC